MLKGGLALFGMINAKSGADRMITAAQSSVPAKATAAGPKLTAIVIAAFPWSIIQEILEEKRF
jgi:hypothetical protein